MCPRLCSRWLLEKMGGKGGHKIHYGNGRLFIPDRYHPECDIGAGCIRSESGGGGWVGTRNIMETGVCLSRTGSTLNVCVLAWCHATKFDF